MSVVYVLSGTTFTAPGDWPGSGQCEVIAGGASGWSFNNASAFGVGAGAGAYSITNTVTASNGASLHVGAGGTSEGQNGGDTWFNGASLAASSCGAKGGTSDPSAGGTGGAAASGVGDVKHSGGNGASSSGAGASGGGGAAGPFGDGGSSASANGGNFGGAGGGGGGGGASAVSPTGGTGSSGGNNHLSAGGGPAATAGTAGGGGGGGTFGGTASGGNGGTGTEWDSSHGAGGGGGGASGSATAAGGNGGLYGGAGAGGGGADFGTGAQGIIVLTYTPSGGSGSVVVYDDAEQTSFTEEASDEAIADDFRNSDNLANIQQWPAEEWCFSADDECQSTDLWIEVASTEQAVVANSPPNVVQEDVIVDWWEGYEDPFVPDVEWSGPIQPNAPPADQPTSESWDFDSEVIETSASIESFQNSDVLQDQPSADAWDWDNEFVEDVLDADATLGASVTPLAQPQDVEWQDEDSEDFWFSDDVLGADVIAAATIVVEDPWSFEADYIEPAVTTEGFQNADVVAPTDLGSPDAWSWDDDVSDELPDDAVLGGNVAAQPNQPADPDWSEEDGSEDYELHIEDFANFELDLPQPDGWDWDNEAVEDGADTDQVLGADIIPPAAQPQDVDWDFTASNDDDWAFDEAQQSPPIVTADQHFGDDAENWDDSTLDESDGTRPDDYQLVNVVIQPVQLFDDPWDWNEDADAELFGFEAQTPADVIAPTAQPADLEWSEEDGAEDYELQIDDFANFELDPPQPDAWDWDSEAVEDSLDTDQVLGANAVPPSQIFDDAWDWNEDGDTELLGLEAQTSTDLVAADLIRPDEWDWSEDTTESADDFSAPVGPDYVPPPSQFTDYGWEWNWDGDFAETEDHLDIPIQDPPIIYTILAPQRLVLDDYGKRITLGAYEVHISLDDYLKRLN